MRGTLGCLEMRILRSSFWLFVPPIAVIVGSVWMYGAVEHYKRETGRRFYSLAGYHYSMPEWGFTYLPGGEQIHRWTVKIPSSVIFTVLLISAIFYTVIHARELGFLPTLGIWVYHFLFALVFLAIVGWVDINVT